MAINTFGAFAVLVTKIGTVAVDVSPSQNHVFPSKITENPVEDGTIFSDHVILLPIQVDIEGRVSDASLTIANAISGAFTGKLSAAEAFNELVKLQLDKEPFVVVTGLKVYQNMMLENLSVPRSSTDGKSVHFNATLKEVQVIGLNTPTNRELIALDVRHSALPIKSGGFVTTPIFT